MYISLSWLEKECARCVFVCICKEIVLTVLIYAIYLTLKSKCSVCYRINTPRRQGGLGPIRIPLLSDLNHQISKDYGVYLEDSGHTLRYLSVILHYDKCKYICNSPWNGIRRYKVRSRNICSVCKSIVDTVKNSVLLKLCECHRLWELEDIWVLWPT